MYSKYKVKQLGFSLVELMIGLVIGLIAALIITNVFSAFERNKRTTTGTADAQTNGSIALYNMTRDMQNAGYGLPVYSTAVLPFACPITTTIDHDQVAATPNIGLSPIVITDGNGANGSDTVSIHYGDSMLGGGAITMRAGTATNVAQVDSNLGCAVNDVALIYNPGSPDTCSMTRVTGLTAAGVTPVKITLASTTPDTLVDSSISCLGRWNEYSYAVNNSNQLTRTGALNAAGVPNAAAVPIVPDIVALQAQYGVSAIANSNLVTQWVNATGTWANPTIADRNRIKSVHIAIVARNGLMEVGNVTAACSSLTAAAPTGLCAWDGSQTNSTAPAIDLSANANWRRYRYRVYETIIPIKNIIYSASVL